ncbi:hypothetical protein [Candidatus Avelusimicrobium stercoris]|uniref:hypothetical protein n=1 Tax=Candidatus Avelusimicrobium stercoris TaxID=1947924 RepID=UPI000EBB3737|nr:hypothetical protein [Elusimicrobiota bacterium]
MKKIIILAMASLVGACTTLTPGQKRAKFESQIRKPEMQCVLKDVGSKPIAAKLPVSLDDAPYYDISKCTPMITFDGFAPFQRINKREVLAFPCYSFVCSRDEIIHIKFPYALSNLERYTRYDIPNELCEENWTRTKYHYTTIDGFKNSVDSFKMIKKRIYSKAERQKMLKEIQKEKQIEAQKKLDEKYENKKEQAIKSYNTCQEVYDKLINQWQTATDSQDYCNSIKNIKDSIYFEEPKLYLTIDTYYRNVCQTLK